MDLSRILYAGSLLKSLHVSQGRGLDKLSLPIVTALYVLAIPLSASQQAELPSDKVSRIEEIVAGEMAKRHIPGLSLAIALNNELVYASGFGMADLEHMVPVTSTTVFGIASITKAVTATAVMQLAEQGKLDLDAPVQQYCRLFPKKRKAITARQLLGHMGRIRHYRGWPEVRNSNHYVTIREALALFKDDPLVHDPGTEFSYSSYGYVLLGCVIEGASGTEYSEYVRRNIFLPAQMTRTEPDDAFKVIPNRAKGYMVMTEENRKELSWFWSDTHKRIMELGKIYNSEFADASRIVPAGGLLSTATDLVRFSLAFQSNSLVTEESRELMWTAQTVPGNEKSTWGLGWIVAPRDGEELVPRLTGSQSGTSSALLLLHKRGFAIAVLSNMEWASLYPMITSIGRIWGFFPADKNK